MYSRFEIIDEKISVEDLNATINMNSCARLEFRYGDISLSEDAGCVEFVSTGINRH